MCLRAVGGQLLAVPHRVAELGCSAGLLGDTLPQRGRAHRLQAAVLRVHPSAGPPSAARPPAIGQGPSRPPSCNPYAPDGPSLPVPPWARQHG